MLIFVVVVVKDIQIWHLTPWHLEKRFEKSRYFIFIFEFYLKEYHDDFLKIFINLGQRKEYIFRKVAFYLNKLQFREV